MLRPAFAFPALLFLCLHLPAQTLPGDTAAAHSHTASFTLPLNGLQVHDRAREAWKWSFGQEPGARIVKDDRNAGIIEGQARVNFRSVHLVGREESMGIVTYRILIHNEAGKCRVLVTDLEHTGNTRTLRGGMHFGKVTRSHSPNERVRGLSVRNAERILEDIKQQSDQHINEAIKRFGTHMRHIGP